MLLASLAALERVDEGTCCNYVNGGLVHAFANGRLHIADPAPSDHSGSWGPGVPVQRTGPLGDTMDYRVGDGDAARIFAAHRFATWDAGWFIAERLDERQSPVLAAWHPESRRLLTWDSSQARRLYRFGEVFYGQHRKRWQVRDASGQVLHEVPQTPDGASPPETANAFRVGGCVYLNTGGDGTGLAYLCRCDAATGQAMETLTRPAGYVCGWSVLGEQTYFIDEHHLYLADAQDLLASRPIAALPESLVFGSRWLWTDGSILYVTSIGGRHLLCFDAQGTPVAAPRALPDAWTVARVDPPSQGWSRVWLSLADRYREWGSAMLLTWPQGSMDSPALFESEPVEASAPEPRPAKGGYHALRIRITAPSAEQAARHGAHHLMRWAYHVAKGTIKAREPSDPLFNGVFELERTTPERLDPQGPPVHHLASLLQQMRTEPQGYRAGNGKGPLHLQVMWREHGGAAAECVYSSL